MGKEVWKIAPERSHHRVIGMGRPMACASSDTWGTSARQDKPDGKTRASRVRRRSLQTRSRPSSTSPHGEGKVG